MIERIDTALPDVFELRPRIFSDERGFFIETYHQARFRELGIKEDFVQDNHSSSVRGTLRGLHYQLRHPQAKLCRVIEGKVMDVTVDIRVGSPHFGKWASVALSAELKNQIYIPVGFAHGYLALTEKVQFLYKCSDFYDPEDQLGICWNDPDLNISWGIASPILSQKDMKNPRLSQIAAKDLPQYPSK